MLTHLCRQTSTLEFNCDYSTKLQDVVGALQSIAADATATTHGLVHLFTAGGVCPCAQSCPN